MTITDNTGKSHELSMRGDLLSINDGDTRPRTFTRDALLNVLHVKAPNTPFWECCLAFFDEQQGN